MKMSHRIFAFLGLAAGVIVVVGLAPVHLAGQAPKAAATAATLQTPWGAPNLQGLWQNEEVTPLERPKQFAGREFLTDAERIAQDKDRAARASRVRGRDQ